MSVAQGSFDRVWCGTSNFVYPGIEQSRLFKDSQDRACGYIRCKAGGAVRRQKVSKHSSCIKLWIEMIVVTVFRILFQNGSKNDRAGGTQEEQ